jgi:hypothetical protein
MAIPTLQLDANIPVALVAELRPVRVTRPATFDPMIGDAGAFPHSVFPGVHEQLHVVMPHPGCIPDAFAFFVNKFGRDRPCPADTDVDRVIEEGDGKDGQKHRHRQYA